MTGIILAGVGILLAFALGAAVYDRATWVLGERQRKREEFLLALLRETVRKAVAKDLTVYESLARIDAGQEPEAAAPEAIAFDGYLGIGRNGDGEFGSS